MIHFNARPDHRIQAGPVRRLLWALGCCVVLALAFAAHVYFQPPPTYEGRTVLSWLNEALQTHGKTNSGASLHALRAIGQPVVPALRAHIRSCRMGDYRKLFFAVQGKLPSRCWIVAPPVSDVDPDLPDLIAVMADLGELAKPAVAEAVLSLRKSNSHFAQSIEMVENLGRMGPAAADAIPYLKELASNWESGRETVAAALYHIDRQALIEAVAELGKKDPALIRSLVKPEWLCTDPELRRDVLCLLEAGGLPKNLAAAWRQLLEPDGKSGVAPSPATVDVD